ncbi:PAS domain-containing sensor histidine kinase [Halorarius halobius]|uniref:PAS domain-containing sensor histidine kinase n=1 Tax=Halorarius halobius TaxID=2962671 RepID=UPI0020CD1E3E|nr:PAS domain S-box protein [Halorarius halobius]
MRPPERCTALLDHAQDIFFVLSPGGEIRFANAAVERLLGYEPADLLGEDAFEYVHPADRTKTRQTFAHLVVSEGAVGEVTHRTYAADGSCVWLESRMEGSALPDLNGYVVSSRDVTGRKEAEREREVTRSRLQEIAASTDDVLWMFSADWEDLLFVNDAYEDIWGRSVEELYENPSTFLEDVHPEDRERVHEAMARVSAGERAEVEYRIDAEPAGSRWVWVKGAPVYEDGEVARIVGFTRDVTDRRRRERQLRVMDRLLRHNLRNDMNVVLGHAEIANEHGDEQVSESMERVVETVEGLLSTAAKSREILRVLSTPSERRRVDVASVVRDAVETVRETYPATTVELSVPERLELSTAPELELAIEELLDNAVRHAGTDAPTVSLAVERRDDTVVIAVTDPGPPIPDNEFEMLFEGRASDVNHGTGMGLWVVYWVVDLADGDLSFDRGDGGNRVVVTLPDR